MASAHTRQRGVVLISVLAVTAVLAAIAWQMVSRQSLVVASMSSASFGLQSQEYLLGAEQYAKQLLVEDWQDEDSRAFDSAAEDWAVTRPPFQIPGGTMEMRVWDLQSRFNLNAMESQEAAFQSLLDTHKIPVAVTSEWLDWIDEDLESRTPGAEDMELLLHEPALRSPNTLAAHASEIRMLPSMIEVPYEEVEPLIVALPSTTLEININTIEPELLEALGISSAVADSITSDDRKYTNLDEVTELEAGQGSGYFVVTSSYFGVWAEIEIGGNRARIESWLYRNPNDGSVHLLGRDLESI